MDDDKIKQLFHDFQPRLSSDSAFLNKLEHNLNSVEMIRQESARQRHRSRVAVIVAVTVGFITGFLTSYLVPYFVNLISHIQLSMPHGTIPRLIATSPATIAWIITGIISFIMTLNAYDLTQSLTTTKKRPS